MNIKINVCLYIIILIILFTTIVNANGFITYYVRPGDTLTSIARDYSVSLKTLIDINNINNANIIVVNQKIKIPDKNTYVVKKGDSLSKIAENFNIKLKDLIENNKIVNPNNIYVGQNIKIPDSNSDNTRGHNSHERERLQLASRSQNTNYIWPVVGTLSSEYGWRIHPLSKSKDFHTGIDIAVPIGTPVYSVEDGIVVHSDWSGGYGKLIIIKHRNNTLSYYAHNHQTLVKKGEKVGQGKIIALSGNTGQSTGPHLHFEIRKNKKHLNPLIYLNN
ncbi:MAG: peptidoglycan DD-metalloendopeptidase family protein, partial [bacterium]